MRLSDFVRLYQTINFNMFFIFITFDTTFKKREYSCEKHNTYGNMQRNDIIGTL